MITIIEMLPTIFIYFIPGYLFIKVISFRFSIKTNNDDHILLKSIVISFIIITLLNQLFNIKSLDFDIENNLIRITIIVCSLITGLLWCKIISCKFVSEFLLKLGFNKSINPNIFDDIIDMEKGLKVLAFLPDEKVIYAGQIRRYEDGDIEDYFIVLSNYSIIGYDGIEIEDRKRDATKWVMLNTKNINRIELIYHEDSAKIKKTKGNIHSLEQKDEELKATNN